jgi:adenylate cyclase
MAAKSSSRDRKTIWLGSLAGAALVIVVGQLLLQPIGDRLARLSYDLPFLWKNRKPPEELVMVYLDPMVKSQLGQSTDQPLDRRFHAQLLERLTRDGARLVLFDILFDSPQADPNGDVAFAEAIRKNGKVVLVGDLGKRSIGDYATSSALPPIPILADAVAGWGLANVVADPDLEVRVLSTGTEDLPSAGWVAAKLLDAPTTRQPESRFTRRWVNYYCEPTALRAANLDQALEADKYQPEYFRDKIVVVGSRRDASFAGAASDEFRTPFSFTYRFGERDEEPMAPGATVHAFQLLNLLRGDWLTRLGSGRESALVFVWGVLISLALMRLRPWSATLVAPVVFGVFALVAIAVQVRYHLWFSWLVPAAAQTSVALLWSVGFQYMVEARRRRKLRGAFASYLSPYMADQIANSEFDLSLGGKEVEATIMFTDLEGFTAMSETLPPAEVSRILTSYFNETTRAILEQDGTIIKYMGDAVLAVWGTPMPEPRHAERAVLAAWGMFQSGQKDIAGRTLRTRIGINSGLVLAGNLGSDFRFDFAAIGNTTNTAARLETLNKYFGTNLLIGEATKAQLSNRIHTRSLGRFLLAGKSQPVTVHEVLGVGSPVPEELAWVKSFTAAVQNYTAHKLDEAEQLFRQTIELRGGQDGPANFYLKQITVARQDWPSQTSHSWSGVIRITSK